MKRNIENLASKPELARITRRKFVQQLTMVAAVVASGAGATPAQQPKSPAQAKSPFTPEDLKPFEEIARRQGMKYIHTEKSTPQLSGHNIHLDMDMVDESIRSAIKYTQKTGRKLTQSKLEHLLAAGTDAQKVEFVFGSGTYYFPEDLDHVAKLSRESHDMANMTMAADCHSVCETIWYVVCRCTGNAQWCKDEARAVCHLVCD